MARLRYLQNKRSGAAGTISKSTNKIYFYDDGMYIGATADGTLALLSDTTLNIEGTTALNLTGTTITLTGAVTVDGDITFSGSDLVLVTVTDPIVDTKGIYCVTNAGGATGWSGSVTGVRGRVYITNTGTSIGNAYGVWAGVKFESTFTATGLGLTCGVYAEAANELAGRAPSAVAYFQEVNSVSGVNTGMPILVLTSTGTAAKKSRIAIEFGYAPAATTVSAGTSEYMYYGNTIRCKINGTMMYLPFSTAEATFTTAYPIDVTVAAGTAITVGTSVTGISMTGTYSTAAISIATDMAAYNDYCIHIAAECDDTSGNTILPLYVTMDIDGAGGNGRAAEFLLAPTATMGDWGNAVKGYLNLDNSAGSIGLLSAVCAETKLPNEAMSGGLTCLEIELVTPGSGLVYGGPLGSLSFIYARVSGTQAGVFDDEGYIINLVGLTDETGHVFYDNTLRIGVSGAAWYLPMSSAQGSFTSAYPVVLTNAAALGITSTVTAAWTYPFFVKGTFATDVSSHGYAAEYIRQIIEANTDISGTAFVNASVITLRVYGDDSNQTTLSSNGRFSAMAADYWTDDKDINVTGGIHSALSGHSIAGEDYTLTIPAEYCCIAAMDFAHASATIPTTAYSGVYIAGFSNQNMGNAIKVHSHVTNFLEIMDNDSIASYSTNTATHGDPDGWIKISIGSKTSYLWTWTNKT